MGRAAPPPSPTVLDNSRASLGWQRGGACNLVPDGPSRCLDDRDGRERERVLTLQSKTITKHALTLRLLNNSDRWSHFPYWKAENNYLVNIFWKITKDLSLGTTGVTIHSFFFFSAKSGHNTTPKSQVLFDKVLNNTTDVWHKDIRLNYSVQKLVLDVQAECLYIKCKVSKAAIQLYFARSIYILVNILLFDSYKSKMYQNKLISTI